MEILILTILANPNGGHVLQLRDNATGDAQN
jgi:hypothetical protein